MAFVLNFLLVSIFGILTSSAEPYSENDIYITNITTYDNLPPKCRLFGIDFPKEKLVSIHLNITTETLYWVGAKIGFPKKFNPIGNTPVKKPSDEEITVDACANKCIDQKYFASNNKTCTCLKSNESLIETTFIRAEGCSEHNVLCHAFQSVLYETDVSDVDYKCEAYRQQVYTTNFEFKFINCLEKTNYGFFCKNGLKMANKNISWYEAYQRCKEKDNNGSELGYPNNEMLLNEKLGSWFWVSLLRRPQLIWGKDFTNTVCVAARIQTNGSYHLESHFCNKQLEALCHKPEHKNGGSSKPVDIATVSGSAGGVVVLLMGIIAVIFKKRRGHLPSIQTPPQEDLDISSTSTGRIMIKGNDEPLYSNSDVPVGDLSIYSLAMADSEPGDNKDTTDKQYDSVTYKEPRNTDEDKHYDHIMENHYQNPYS